MSAAAEERGERRQPRGSEIPAAVHWYESMLLAPQHFQQASHRGEALLHYHASVASPFHWGLMDLGRKPLTDGVLEIDRVEAVMPDGLVAGYPRRDGQKEREPLRIDLNELRPQIEQGKQTVFLTVAARQPGERFNERYEIGAQDTSDELTGTESLSIQLLHPHLKLVLGNSLPGSSVGFPIARVAIHGSAIEETPFEPPWLRVRSGLLQEICRDLAFTLREKATSLATSIAQTSASSRQPQLLETRLLVHSLVSVLPPLEALIDSGVAHPFTLYLALAAVAGNLAPGQVPDHLACYDHDDLLLSFRSVVAAIAKIMKTAIRAPYTLHPFTAEGDDFRLLIMPQWPRHAMLLGVSAPPGVTEKDVDDWVMNSTIGARSLMDSLRRRRALGVKLERMRDPALLPASGVTFYKLRPNDEHVVPSEDLIVNNADHERRPLEIVLYVNTEA